ncbi:hypothetical protein BC830DRAFT_1174178 [Chytriomyces sp. MP71]|nr:hypothetical protein BC830DRAFT_1174178 [Chytriomyces sp. MP71]
MRVADEAGRSLGFPQIPFEGRDDPLHSGITYLRGIGKEENIPPTLWRLHNAFYDLTDFATLHPGGVDWIARSRGADITEAYEAMHPDQSVSSVLLKKYFVRNVPAEHLHRVSPLTFHEDGFYKTLQARALPIIRAIKASKAGKKPSALDASLPTREAKLLRHGNIKDNSYTSRLILDMQLFAYIVCLTLAATSGSYLASMAASIAAALVSLSAHNFFHQRNNWRMWTHDVTGFTVAQWRTSHAMSHHFFANTMMDMEVSHWEPFMYLLPKQQGPVGKGAHVLAVIGANIMMGLASTISLFQQIAGTVIEASRCLSNPDKLAQNQLSLDWLIVRQQIKSLIITLSQPLIFLSLALATRGIPFETIAHQYLFQHLFASWVFLSVGLYTSHHQEDVWHQGDKVQRRSEIEPPPVQVDFGLFQLLELRDKVETTNSLWMNINSYGDHALHHLYPTIDQANLPYLYPLLMDHCRRFHVPGPDKIMTGGSIGVDGTLVTKTGQPKADECGNGEEEEDEVRTSESRLEATRLPFSDGMWITSYVAMRGFYRTVVR